MPRVDDSRVRTSDVEDDDHVVGESLERRIEAPSSFASLLLREEVVRGLEKEGFVKPSPIQVHCSPCAVSPFVTHR